MEMISLNISQDDKWNFFVLYDKLGPLQKKIWQRIVWYVKKYPNANPSQFKISVNIPCSRKHVNRTLALFKRHGWLSLISRGLRRTKTLFIPYHLLMIDVSKREYLRKLEVTSEVTHSYSSIYPRTRKKTGALEMPIRIQKMKISWENKVKLSLIPEKYLDWALESAKLDQKKGKIFTNPESYVVGTAIKMALKQKHPINWGLYFQHKESSNAV